MVISQITKWGPSFGGCRKYAHCIKNGTIQRSRVPSGGAQKNTTCTRQGEHGGSAWFNELSVAFLGAWFPVTVYRPQAVVAAHAGPLSPSLRKVFPQGFPIVCCPSLGQVLRFAYREPRMIKNNFCV